MSNADLRISDGLKIEKHIIEEVETKKREILKTTYSESDIQELIRKDLAKKGYVLDDVTFIIGWNQEYTVDGWPAGGTSYLKGVEIVVREKEALGDEHN